MLIDKVFYLMTYYWRKKDEAKLHDDKQKRNLLRDTILFAINVSASVCIFISL